jgi:hypothetical protein
VEQKKEYQLPYAYKKVRQLKNSETSIWNLYCFESLTLRALEKLCFGLDKNTFIEKDEELFNELKQKSPSFFIMKESENVLKRKDQFIAQNQDGTWDESELISFYQIILSLEATKKMILVEEYLPNDSETK